jgi:hypothetical protein
MKLKRYDIRRSAGNLTPTKCQNPSARTNRAPASAALCRISLTGCLNLVNIRSYFATTRSHR